VSFLVVPDGRNVHDLKPLIDQYRTKPARREGVAVLRDIESLVAHVNRFKDGDSVLFADPSPKAPVLVAVLDYHRRGAPGDGGQRFGKHRARYAFPLSDQWKAWTERNDKPFSQGEFCAFIEDRIADVADPANAGEGLRAFATLIGAEYASPSRLLEVSRGLSINDDLTVKSHQNLSSGETQFVFGSVHKDESGQPVRVPRAFIIAIPVFELGAVHLIAARLRYRLDRESGHLTWFYSLYRVAENFDVAIREACSEAQAGTDLPLLYGTPEG
jgi:uncharacterized protein YfdQ (DUF2303 family)